jgi:hypothetical protein
MYSFIIFSNTYEAKICKYGIIARKDFKELYFHKFSTNKANKKLIINYAESIP